MIRGKGINDMPKGWRIENEWNKQIYQMWANMIKRCYDKNYHKTHPTYIGCTVCDRWLILSNFVADVKKIDGFDKERILNGELELDKDKKKDKNKQYIMKYCTWLPRPENISLAHKGKQLSEEHKQKISDSLQGRTLSEEHKLKMSENCSKPMKDKFGSEHPNSKKVAQYDKTTNELIKIWDSTMDAERELGINHSNISKCCNGKLKTVSGFIWRYVKES